MCLSCSFSLTSMICEFLCTYMPAMCRSIPERATSVFRLFDLTFSCPLSSLHLFFPFASKLLVFIIHFCLPPFFSSLIINIFNLSAPPLPLFHLPIILFLAFSFLHFSLYRFSLLSSPTSPLLYLSFNQVLFLHIHSASLYSPD